MSDSAAADVTASTGLELVTLVVRDYDEAIAWFTKCLRFTLLEDTPLGDGKRWVRIANPETAPHCSSQRQWVIRKSQRLAIKPVAGLASF